MSIIANEQLVQYLEAKGYIFVEKINIEYYFIGECYKIRNRETSQESILAVMINTIAISSKEYADCVKREIEHRVYY